MYLVLSVKKIVFILLCRDLDMIRGYTEDRDSLERQIEILQ